MEDAVIDEHIEDAARKAEEEGQVPFLKEEQGAQEDEKGDVQIDIEAGKDAARHHLRRKQRCHADLPYCHIYL